jgi:arylsulfatase A-like enzyme/Flp pilus assembly protein TadD
MLTGTIPPYHGVHDNVGYRLSDSNVTLAERLRERGYRTAAVVGSAVLDSQTGLDQGFVTYNDDLPPGFAATGGRPERRGDEVSRIANVWLDQHASKPFFLFVHYFDPHDPYVPPEPFASQFAGDLYAGEVAYTDQCIGTLIQKLKDLGVYDSSIVVIVGDHGESLGEHGEPTHCYYIYHSTTKVPLVIKPSGRIRPKRVDETVALIDIVPTVLAQLGIPPPEDLHGEDLTPHIAGKSTAGKERYVYSESHTATRYGCSSLLGIETSAWKYIQTSKPELYNLALDPGETHNLVDEHAEHARALQDMLRALLAEHHRDRRDEAVATVDPQQLARLQALGYVGGPVTESFDFAADKEDPKDFAEVYWKLLNFTYLANMKQNAEARELGTQVLATRPDIADVHERLARIAVDEGDIDAAITHFSEVLKLQPDSPDAAGWHANLGAALSRRERFDEAIEHYRQALALAQGQPASTTGTGGGSVPTPGMKPVLLLAHLNLGHALFAQGKFQEAGEEYREVIKINANHAGAHYQLARCLSKLGRTEEAAEEHREAARLNPAFRDLDR